MRLPRLLWLSTNSKYIILQVFIHNLVHGDLHPGNILVQDDGRGGNKLVLLDCGIATSLKKKDLENIKAVFTAIVNGEVSVKVLHQY